MTLEARGQQAQAAEGLVQHLRGFALYPRAVGAPPLSTTTTTRVSRARPVVCSRELILVALRWTGTGKGQ